MSVPGITRAANNAARIAELCVSLGGLDHAGSDTVWWDIGDCEKLAILDEIERQSGVAFRDNDREQFRTVGDLINAVTWGLG